MSITTYPPGATDASGGLAALANAAGADGTLTDLGAFFGSPGTIQPFRPDDLISCVFDGQDPTNDLTSYFYRTVVSHSGVAALKQKQALPGPVQGITAVVLGVRRPA